MPLVIHPRVRKAIRRVAILSGFAVLAGAGSAMADCTSQSLSTPFTQWGDNNTYFQVPGGSFEGTSDQVGWTLSGASLTAGNETFDVDGAGDDQSLTVDAGGSATSPFFCVDNTMSNLRFFAQQAGAGSDLRVDALVQTDNGVTTVPVGSIADGAITSWAPTETMLGSAGQLADGQTLQVALRFSVPAAAGSWQVDDIYIDPFRAG